MFLYPTIKKFLFLVIAVMLAASVSAQKKADAKFTKQNTAADQVVISQPSAQVLKVTGRTDRKVSLVWLPLSEDVSHYVIERSIDGKRFQEIGYLMTGDGSQEAYYEFTDRFRSAYPGQLFYRLRVEQLNGNELYTAITVLNSLQQ